MSTDSASGQSVGLRPSVRATPQTVIEITPSRGWIQLGLGELWDYRELLYFLTLRDIKVRYKQTVLGAAWALIQPFFTMVIFSLFFGRLAGVPSDGIPYPLFAYVGLLPWTFFSNATATSGNSLVANSNLITKVYFPRLIIPGASVAAGLVDTAIGYVLLFAMMVYYDIRPSWSLVFIPAIIALTALFSFATGVLFSALNAKFRDVRYALPFVLQIWMFLTPIIYPTSLLSAKYQWLLYANPLTGIIDAQRSLILDKPISSLALAVSTVITAVLLAASIVVFRRMEREFADVV